MAKIEGNGSVIGSVGDEVVRMLPLSLQRALGLTLEQRAAQAVLVHAAFTEAASKLADQIPSLLDISVAEGFEEGFPIASDKRTRFDAVAAEVTNGLQDRVVIRRVRSGLHAVLRTIEGYRSFTAASVTNTALIATGQAAGKLRPELNDYCVGMESNLPRSFVQGDPQVRSQAMNLIRAYVGVNGVEKYVADSTKSVLLMEQIVDYFKQHGGEEYDLAFVLRGIMEGFELQETAEKAVGVARRGPALPDDEMRRAIGHRQDSDLRERERVRFDEAARLNTNYVEPLLSLARASTNNKVTYKDDPHPRAKGGRVREVSFGQERDLRWHVIVRDLPVQDMPENTIREVVYEMTKFDPETRQYEVSTFTFSYVHVQKGGEFPPFGPEGGAAKFSFQIKTLTENKLRVLGSLAETSEAKTVAAGKAIAATALQDIQFILQG